MDKKLIDIARSRHAAAWFRLQNLYPTLQRVDIPALEFSNRLTKSAGYCVMAERRIVLAAKFYVKHPTEMGRVIVPHELCHYADYVLNGVPKNNRWHGKTWQQTMLKFGLEPSPYHNMSL